MFDHIHYVPILRWKLAERGALANLQHPICDVITPLIEPTGWVFGDTEKRKTLESKIAKIAEDIFQHWGEDPFFMDFWLVPPSARIHRGDSSFLLMAREARTHNLNLIPVIGLKREPKYQSAVNEIIAADRFGLCLRIFSKDLEETGLPEKMDRLLTELQVQPSNVDLILDVQCVGEATPNYSTMILKIPYLDRWRTFTIAGGSFPKDLQGFKPGKGIQPRWEWRKWKECVEAHGIARLPAFSDYTIQYPLFEEPPKGAAPSASIRYTYYDDWVVIKGLSIRRDDAAGNQQWPANAEILCKQNEFMGATFSKGDKYINDTSKQTAHPGNATSWLRAGFNHHILHTGTNCAFLKV